MQIALNSVGQPYSCCLSMRYGGRLKAGAGDDWKMEVLGAPPLLRCGDGANFRARRLPAITAQKVSSRGVRARHLSAGPLICVVR